MRHDTRHIIGVSWTDRPGGFRYFVGLRVTADAGTPDRVPAHDYVTYEHRDGEVFDSYRQMFRWIAEQGATHEIADFTLLEEYPIDTDPFRPPQLRLMVPAARGLKLGCP